MELLLLTKNEAEGREQMKKYKKSKKAPYYSGESWKTKKRQKKDIDKKKEMEAFEVIRKTLGI